MTQDYQGVHGTASSLEEAARVRAEEAGADYEVGLESLNQWQLAWRKFKRHRLALVGLGLLSVLVAAAIIGPLFLAGEQDFQGGVGGDVLVRFRFR